MGPKSRPMLCSMAEVTWGPCRQCRLRVALARGESDAPHAVTECKLRLEGGPRTTACEPALVFCPMATGDGFNGRKTPAHAEHRGLPRTSEQRLAELGRHLPPPSEEALEVMAADRSARVRRRLVAGAVTLLVVALVAVAAVQWFRPLPQPSIEGLTTPIHLAGSAPVLPWPSDGEAAVTVEGVGSLGQVRASRPVPVAGLASVLTAYVVLRDHPLASGAAGPSITVTPATVAASQAGTAFGESEVAVSAGENLTELQALEGLLVDSGNDMAILLADWDAGSTAAFVAKMNRTAGELRLGSTHITDPSGQDAATTSTPDDLIRLGEAAMSMSTLREIVDLGQTNLPKAGLVYNLDFDLGLDGIVGIETGSDTAANGCYLFAARRSIGGSVATVIGVVLGQAGPTGPNNAAVDAGDALVKASEFSLGARTVIPAGRVVGQLTTPWGASTPVTAAAAVTVLGWPGLSVPASVHLDQLVAPLSAGTAVGVLHVQQGGHVTHVFLRTSSPLRGPSAWWRLTR